MSDFRQVGGYIHSIETFGGVDGPGVRYVVFFQGCPLRCIYCHNPDSWEFGAGTRITAGELTDKILDYKNYIRRGGVTLSGGEPLAQPEFAGAVLRLCEEHGIHTAVDTSGVVPLSVSAPCIDAASLVLLDIKAFDDQDVHRITGRSGGNARATLDYCERTEKPVWIRHVCLPGYTMDVQKLSELADYLKDYQWIERIELIAFHQLGSHKWDFMDEPYLLSSTPQPTVDEMETARNIFRERGFTVQ